MKSRIQATPRLKPSQAALALAALLAAHSASAQSIWTGGGAGNSTTPANGTGTVLTTGANYFGAQSNATITNSGSSLLFNGSDNSTVDLTLGSLIGGGTGSGGSQISVAGTQTNALTITGNSSGSIRLNTSGVVIASGAGAVTFAGTGGFTMGGITGNSIHAITNNSTNTLDMGVWTVTPGGASVRTVSVNGSGNVTSSGVWGAPTVPERIALSKSGTGTLTLSGNNVYTGGSTISGGAIVLSGSGTLGNTTSSLTMNGGALNLGGLTTTVAAVSISSASASGDTISNGNLNGTSYSVSNGSGTVAISASLQGSGALTKSGAGTLTLNNSNSYSGGTSITAGNLIVGTAGTLGTNVNTNNVSVGAGANLLLNAAANIGGSQILNISSNGTALGGVGVSYNGALPTINATGTGTDGGVFAVNYTGNASVTSLASLATSLNANGGSGQWFLGSQSTGTFNGTALAPAADGIYRLGGGGGALTFNQTNVITGTNSVQIGSSRTNGGGTVVLGAGQNYTGSTSINGGTLKLGNAGALGDGTNNTSGVTVNGSAILDFAGFTPTATVPLTMNSSASSNDVGALQSSISTLVTYSGSVTLNRNTVVGVGSIEFTGGFFGGGFNLNKDGQNTLAITNGGTTTLNQLRVNRGVVQVNAGTTLNVATLEIGTGNGVAGTLTLNGGNVTSTGQARFGQQFSTNPPTGTLNLNSGTLTVPALTKGNQTFNANFNGGTLKASGNSTTFFQGATSAQVQNGGAVIDDGGYDITIGQNLLNGGTGGLTKQGNGILTLTGNNTYTGGTTITGGLINFSNISNFGSGNITLDGGGVQWATSYVGGDLSTRTITIAGGNGTFNTNGNNVTLANAIGNSGSGQLIKAGAGNLTIASLSSTGGTSVQQGSLNISSASGNIATSGGTSTNFSGNSTYSGSISGAGNVAINSGTVTFSGNNTYTGQTNVTGGKLLVNGSLANTVVTVGTGATLGGSGTISGSTTVQSGGTLAPGNSPGLETFTAGLTLNSGSTFVFDLNDDTTTGRGTVFDAVDVTGGTFTISAGTVSFNIVLNGSGSATDFTDAFWSSSQSWLVFDNANMPTISGSFVVGTITADTNAAAFGTAATAGGAFSFTQTGTDIYLTYTAIPEPSAYAALAGLGVIGLAVYRRRKSAARQ